jgi:hypothetical protein
VKYTDSRGLARAVSTSPAVASCLVNRVYSYGIGRPLKAQDRTETAELRKRFEKEGRRLPELLRAVATLDDFYTLNAPKQVTVQNGAGQPKLVSQVTAGELR